MKQAVKISLIVAAALILGGIVIGVIGLSKADWKRKSDDVFERHELFFPESDISVIKTDCSSADIKVTANTDDTIKIVYYDSERRRYSVQASDGLLMVKDKDNRKWYEFITPFWVSWQQYELQISIPGDFRGELEIYNSSGLIDVSGISISGSLKLRASSGDIIIDNSSSGGAKSAGLSSGSIKISDTGCGGSVEINSSSGDVFITDLLMDGQLKADLSSGDVSIENITGAGSVTLTSSSGGIRMSGIRASSFDIDANSGNIVFADLVPVKSMVLRSSSGNIKGTIDDTINSFTITSKASSGDNNLPGSLKLGDIILDVRASSGDIDISFADRQ